MKNILSIFTLLILAACNHAATENENVSASDTLQTVSENTSIDEDGVESGAEDDKTEIIIKNKADYSEKFIEGLNGLGYSKFELRDNLLLIDGQDTAYFPKTPKIGNQLVFTGKKDNLDITLKVKRINHTTVAYNIEMIELGKASYTKTGKADMNSGFFLGGELDESEKTGISYLVTEFIDQDDKDCYFNIRIGSEKGTNPKLLCKLNKNCNGEMKVLTLDNFPALTEK